MPKLISIKPKRLVTILLLLGFETRDAEGSHIFFKHSTVEQPSSPCTIEK